MPTITAMRKRWKSIGLNVLLLIISFIMIYPWLIAFSTSLKPIGETSINRSLIPLEPTLFNFEHVWRVARVPLLGFNSIVVTVSSVVLILFFASLASYSFARFDFALKEPLYFLFLTGLMLQAAALIIPLYQVNIAYGLLNTHFALIGPYTALGLPFSILLLRGFFEGLPREIEEAAIIDGASRITIFWRIALPLTKPALAR